MYLKVLSFPFIDAFLQRATLFVISPLYSLFLRMLSLASQNSWFSTKKIFRKPNFTQSISKTESREMYKVICKTLANPTGQM